MSNVKVAMEYAAKLDREALEDRLNTKMNRNWVGLTNEEIGGLTVFDGLHHVSTPLLAEFIKSIEAKLKDKNDPLFTPLGQLWPLDVKRNWVGLSGKEINHIFAANVGYPERMMKEVENLLKEKNT